MDVYCTVSDVTDRLTMEPDRDDRRFIRAMIDEATVAIDAYMGGHVGDEVPSAVRVVCARVAARAVSRGLFAAPVGAESQSFTAEDKRMLRSVGGGRRGAFTVSLY